jgi:hypothetical protein
VLFRKICLRFAATRDAKGAYGKTLAEWVALCAEIKKEREKAEPSTFPISAYMARRVKKYRKERTLMVERFRKRTRKLYNNIKNQYLRYADLSENYDTSKCAYNSEINYINDDINENDSELNKKNAFYQQANHQDIVTPEMGARNLHELHEQIINFKGILLGLHEKKREIETKRKEMESVFQEELQKAKFLLSEFLMRYESRFIVLHSAIELIECKHDEELAYYLYCLGFKRDISTGGIPFKIVCELCGFQIDDISVHFADEQNCLAISQKIIE